MIITNDRQNTAKTLIETCRFPETSGQIVNRGDHILVRLNRRTYSPVLRHADLPAATTVPWRGGHELRFEIT